MTRHLVPLLIAALAALAAAVPAAIAGVNACERLATLCEGGDGRDLLTTGDTDDVLHGNDGNDRLNAQGGNDQLFGGGGDDTFVFTGGGGQDVVMDFKPGDDVLQIARNINGLDIGNASDVAARVLDSGGNAVIDLGNGDTVTLMNVNAQDVHNNPNAFFVIS
jgi:Ca2+-binding RTX toxin-like protein